MKKLIFIYLVLIPVFVFGQADEQLIILYTTDVHGSIRPYDYYSDVPSDNGLAKVYTKVKEFRSKHKNVLLQRSYSLI